MKHTVAQSPPFFSIIITTHNRADLLARALNSLLKQTDTDWEAILVDDGSTDNTPKIVRQYSTQFVRFTHIRQENQGVIGAKNRGILAANGTFIGFLDSDDEYKPDHLRSRKELLLKNPDIDFLHGGVEIIGSEFVPDCHHRTNSIHLDNCSISGTFLIKREAAIALKGFSGSKLGTDADFMLRAQMANLSILKTSLPTYRYHRDTDRSITKDAMTARQTF